jgi:threonine/homoserine/homoserine lactone efflux protein
MLGQIAAFTVAATVITITPGADMALVARRAITDGWGRASVTSAGVLTGLLVHATASAAGISAILVRSATAFTVVKIVGACYLVLLGILSFRAARHAAREPAEGGGVVRERLQPSWRTSFVQGFLNNVLNPKPALFYLAFLPQFIHPGDPVLTLTAILVAIHIAIGIVWLLTWGWLVSRASGALTRSQWRARLERVTGCILVGLGLRLATTSR